MDPSTFAYIAHYIGIGVFLKFVSFIFPNWFTCLYTFAANILLFFVVGSVTYEFQKRKYCRSKVNPLNKAVFITGCDTGFGHSLARRLDFLGFRVFAGCLFPSKNGALDLVRASSNQVRIVEIDVTKDDSVKNAANFVKENLETSELWAVVNNAGVVKGMDVELSSMEDYNQSMQVNALGPVRVTKAFLPLIRKSKGRIVNVNSVAGRVALPQMGPYAMSKFAAVAFTESLRYEMKVWGIRVISIEPEKFRSPMTTAEYSSRIFEESLSSLDKDVRAEYGEAFFVDYRKYMNLMNTIDLGNPKNVIQTLEDAVCLKYPYSTYRVYGKCKSHILIPLAECLPQIVLAYILNKHHGKFNFPTPKNAYNSKHA